MSPNRFVVFFTLSVLTFASAATRPPAPDWTQAGPDAWYEGALLGNGDLGVVVYGASDELFFAVGKNDFWDRRSSARFFKPVLFQTLMQMVHDASPADPRERNRLLFQLEGAERPRWNTLTPKPVCRVTVAPLQPRSLAPVRHCLSLEQAQLSTSTSILSTTAWVQKDENLLLLRVTPPAEGAVVTLYRKPDSLGVGIASPEHRIDGGAAIIVQDMPAEPTYPQGFRCVVAAQMSGAGAPRMQQGRIAWKLGGPAVLMLAAVTTRDHGEPEQAARRLLARSIGDGAPALETRHRNAWKAFWDKSWITLDDPEVERLWYLHNYLLACAARPGAVAPGLFTPWIVPDYTAWNNAYVMDYNFQMTFAACLSSNHFELMQPYLDTIERMLPAARGFARDIYGCTGIAFPHEIYPIDMRREMHVTTAHVCETPWAVQYFWEYYLYTMDEDFLRRRAYPVLAECADFLADFATDEGNGKYAFYPTVSPEHHGNLPGLPYNRNGAPELAFARYTLQAALEGARRLGEESPRTRLWARVLAGLPDYPRMRNQLGDVYLDCEPTTPELHFVPPVPFSANARPSKTPGNHGPWMTYNVPTSLLQVYPADQIDTDSPLAELLTAIRTWETGKFEGSNDPILRHVMAARLGLVTLPDFMREIRPRLLPNGSITCQMNPLFPGEDPDYIYQYRAYGVYTENFSYPLVVNEMMLQSQRGVIKLFPTLDYYRTAEFHGLRARGGFVVSARAYRGFTEWAELEATADGPCRVRLPWPASGVSLQDADTGAAVEWKREGEDMVFAMRRGERRRLEPVVRYQKEGRQSF